MEYTKNLMNCLKCHHRNPENGNCVAVGGFCTSVPAAYCPLIPELLARCTRLEEARERANEACAKWEARAERAERERDAAIKELDDVESAVDDLSEFIDDQIHPLVSYDIYTALRENADAVSMWQYESEWRGTKEE